MQASTASLSVDAASTSPTNPGPLSRLPRDAVQVCFAFLGRDDLATTHRVSRVWRAAHDAERSRRKLFAQQIPRMLQRITVELHSEDDRVVVAAVKELRELLCLDSAPIAQVLRSKSVLERLITLMQRDHPILQRETAGVLTNLIAGTTEQCGQVLNAGALPVFVRMLSDHRADYREGQEQAVWAVRVTLKQIGNIAADSHSRDQVLDSGALPALLTLLSSGQSRVSLRRNAMWAVANCVRGKSASRWAAGEPALPVLMQILAKELDVEVLSDACLALSFLSIDSTRANAQISALLAAGVMPHLIRLLQHQDTRILTQAMRTVGNMLGGNALQTSAVINAGFLPVLRPLLSHARREVRNEALWALSSVTTCSSHQIQACLDAGLLSDVIELLLSNSDEDEMLQCACALTNALNGGSVLQALLWLAPQTLQRVMQAGDAIRDGGLDAETAAIVAALCPSGQHPFTARVAATCMRHLHAVASSDKIGQHISSTANHILKTWWSEAEVKEAIEAQRIQEQMQAAASASSSSPAPVSPLRVDSLAPDA